MGFWNKFYHGTPKDAFNASKKLKVKVIDVTNTLLGNKAVNLITDHNEKVTHIIIGMDNEITSINRKLSILESKFESFEKEKTNRKLLLLFLIISIIINVASIYFYYK